MGDKRASVPGSSTGLHAVSPSITESSILLLTHSGGSMKAVLFKIIHLAKKFTKVLQCLWITGNTCP